MKIKLKIQHPNRIFNKNYYDNLFDYSKFTEVHYGGASSGKSHGVVQKVIIKSIQQWRYPRKVLFLRKVSATIKDSIFEDVRLCLEQFQLLDKCKVNKTDYRIELPNGAVFLFKGMDNSEKIKSIKGLSDIVMEEASEFFLDDYTQLTLRLREKKHLDKQIYLMFNPISKLNWVYKAFFNKQDDDVIIYHTTYKDNKFLDNKVKENLMKLSVRNEPYYKIYALGEFATLDKLVFPKYERKLLNKDDEKLRYLESYFGLDYGFINDPSAFIHVKVDMENKKLYVVEEYVKKHMLNDEIAEVIKTLGYDKEIITADSAEKKSNQEIRNLGVHRIQDAVKGPDSVINGIQFMQQFEIIIDERCVKTIEEFENYTWTKDRETNEYINIPVDSYNHCIDAIRYAIGDLMQGSQIKAKTFKSIF